MSSRYAGVVVERNGGSVAGYRVEAWDVDQKVTSVVCVALTDLQGRFSLSLGDDQAKQLFGDSAPVLFFRVSSGGDLYASTENSLRWEASRNSEGTIPIDAGVKGKAPVGRYSVEGVVADEDGVPVSRTVTLYRRSLSASAIVRTAFTPNATAVSNATTGYYRIQYDFVATDTAAPDLELEAIDGGGAPLGLTTICAAPPRARADLILKTGSVSDSTGRRFSGKTRYSDAKGRLDTVRGARELKDFDAPAVAFAVCQTGLATDDIQAVVDAHKLAAADAAYTFTSAQEIYYGLFRRGLPSVADDLFAHNTPTLLDALDASISDRTVSSTIVTATARTNLMAAARKALSTATSGRLGLGEIVALAHIGAGGLFPAAEQNAFLNLALEHESDSVAFWAAVDATPLGTISANAKLAFKFGVEVARLVGAYAPALTFFYNRMGVAPLTNEAKSLANFIDWTTFKSTMPDAPVGTPGATAPLRVDYYANIVAGNIERRFRMGVMRSAIAAGAASDLKTFLTNANPINAAFDFDRNRVAVLMAGASTAGVGNVVQLTKDLKSYERLQRVTTTFTQAQTLFAAGLTSATKIHNAGKAQLATLFSADVAAAIHEAACAQVSTASAYSAKYNGGSSMFIKALPDVTTAMVSLPAAIPDWGSLFAPLDQCACAHCRSVLGPAAYLVDVLLMLGRVKGTSTTARAVLKARRPDLERVALSCENADTPIPYIDIVNEILEVCVSSVTWPTTPTWPSPTPPRTDTLITAAEAAVNPDVLFPQEHIGAYRTLSTAVHPLQLPFHFWQEEARVYLRSLGVPRNELLKIFATSTLPTARDVAVERVGIASAHYDILALAAPTAPQVASYWNTFSNDPKTFMRKLGISFDEARELFSTTFCRTASIGFAANTACDLSLPLTNLGAGTEASQHVIHRLIRLRNATGWTISEADKARVAFTTFDTTSLPKIAGVRWLQERFPLEAAELLSWYAAMDVDGTWSRSLFERVFQDKRLNALDATFETLRTGGSVTVTINEALPTLLAAFQAPESELRLLTDTTAANYTLKFAAEVNGTQVLTVTNLSRLHRLFSFSRAARLSISDYLTVLKLSLRSALLGDPSAADPDSTLLYLDLVDRIRASGLTIEDVHFIVRHVAPPESTLVPTTTDQDAWAGEITAGVARACQDAKDVFDDGPLSTSLSASFATLLGSVSPATLAADILNLGSLATGWTPTSGPANIADFITALSPFLGDDATASLSGGSALAVGAPRFSYIARGFQRSIGALTFVKGWIAQTFSVSLDVAAWLLESGILLTPIGGFDGTNPLAALPLWRSFLVANGATELPKANTAALRIAATRLHKATFVTRKLSLTVDELKGLYFAPVNTSSRYLFLQDLPVVAPASTTITLTETDNFADLMRLIDATALMKRWRAGVPSYVAITTAARAGTALATLQADIAKAMGWPEADVIDLSTRFAAALPSAFQDEVMLLRIERAMLALQKLGVSAKQVLGATPATDTKWTAIDAALPAVSDGFSNPATTSLTIAREIKRAARAKAGDAWGESGRTLRNILRERQRDALVGHLIKKGGVGFETPSKLFENLLIDVEMSAEALTSRLVSAHGSAQLFTNRILMNLESTPGFTNRVDLANEWRWMKNYRVWEANRKVFLWPENWIEAELRDDKSELFKDLESKLLSGPVTPESAEDAYRTYLDDLATLAQLEIVATYEEVQTISPFPRRTKTTLHAFGRTPAPHRYFHREKVDGKWSNWTELDLEIEGDHLIPVMHGGRLYLFWPVMEPVAKDTEPRPAPVPDTSPLEDALAKAEERAGLRANRKKNDRGFKPEPLPLEMKVRLAVSERRHSGWTPPKTSEDEVLLGAAPAPIALSFTGQAEGTSIVVKALYEPRKSGDIYNNFQQPLKSVTVARFRFLPGTNTIRSAPVAELIDTKEVYSIDANPVAAPNSPTSALVAVLRPSGGSSSYQGFFANTGALKLPIRIGNADISSTILTNLPKSAIVVWARGRERQTARRHIFVRDSQKTFALTQVQKKIQTSAIQFFNLKQNHEPGEATSATEEVFRFELFYHPFVDTFRQTLAMRGLEGLLWPWLQGTTPVQSLSTTISTGSAYTIVPGKVETPFPKETVDFTYGSAFGSYNWELFFHAPFLISTRLTAEGRYAEAEKWLHAIFDPTDGTAGSDVTKFWKFKPFAENKSLAEIQQELTSGAVTAYGAELGAAANAEVATPAADTLNLQIQTFRKDPFDPHAIARLRVVAYQKAVVIKYLDNLLAWADSLFTQDSIESINEATQLYIRALHVLGDRPVLVPDPTPPAVQSISELDATSTFDSFGNALAEVESITPVLPPPTGSVCAEFTLSPPNLIWGSTYFCVPPNEKLTGYWDTIADRLFKIRHSLNIEGVARVLPLFQPPIDPALLVRAVAAGVDIGSVVNDLSVAPAPYRYAVLSAKAAEYTNSVIGLGQSLLSALEKKDAEELSRLRLSHEIANGESTRDIKRAELKEAKESLTSVERAQRLVQERFEYYSSREFMSAGETAALELGFGAQSFQLSAQAAQQAAAGVGAAIDNYTGVAGLGPLQAIQVGGSNFGRAAAAEAEALTAAGGALGYLAGVTGTLAGYERRMDDWQHQAKLAQLELRQTETQLEAARLRVAIKEQEVRLAENQFRQSRDVDRFMRSKFTSQELYGWMTKELAAVYQQAYRLAYDMSRRAERAFQFERGDNARSFVKFGQWDGLRKGLLAGERLAQDLRRMDAAYHLENKRDYELTKTISLGQLAPDQLIQLRSGAPAQFTFSEQLFDDDFGTHYLRRLKSVSVSVHASPGAYENVSGKLSLLNSQTRPTAGGGVESWRGVVSATATSSGREDAGVFELNMRDDRFLPFEGAGAHSSVSSQWRFELSSGNTFPSDSISDVVLRVAYTARDGRSAVAPSVNRSVFWRINETHGDAFRAFVEQLASTIPVTLRTSDLPGQAAHKSRTITTATKPITVYAQWSGSAPNLKLTPPSGSPVIVTPTTIGGSSYKSYAFTISAVAVTGTQAWSLQLDPAAPATQAQLVDLWIELPYLTAT